jgi:O-antigen/teichoic acid export membrane protein
VNTRQLLPLLRQATQSAVVWSWGMNVLRLGSSLILLPLLVHQLSTADLGMHYILLNVGALAAVLDFGFSGAVWRAVAHASAGGREMLRFGVAEPPPEGGEPNHQLIWDLMAVARRLYGGLALVALGLIGTLGTLLVNVGVAETSSPTRTWLAWGATLLLTVWEVYASWWSAYLMGLNRVATYAQLNFLAYLLKLAGSAVLLWLGVGLLSVPIAGLVAVCVQRTLARRACLRCLGEPLAAATPPARVRELVSRLWPNASRIGFLGVGSYLGGQAMAFLCLTSLGLAANAEYGLSLQIMSVAQGMATVWMQVKWPEIARLRTQGDFAGIRRLLRERLWLSVATFVFLVAVAIPLAPPLLQWLHTDKVVLPAAWLVVMAVHTLLELHLSIWGMLIYTDNRVDYLRPLLLANLGALGLAVALLQFTGLGLGALVLAPLLAGAVFNYWHWPRVGGELLQTTWSRLLFARRAD